ncbi:MAG: CRTAC1 family protein [Verrucomicrobiota bacterium]
MKPRSNAPTGHARHQESPRRPPQTKTNPTFASLFALAWLGAGATVIWPASALAWIVVGAVIAAAWIGRAQPALWRVLLVVPLLFPASRLASRSLAKTLPPPQATAAPAPTPAAQNDDDTVRALVTAEETYLVLTRKMELLGQDLLGLRLPGPAATAANVFGPTVLADDLGPLPAITTSDALVVEARSWPLLADPKPATQVNLWRPLLDGVATFDHGRFYLVGGQHPSGDLRRYIADGRFEGLAQMKTGEWRSFQAKLKLDWQRSPSPNGQIGEWQITGWTTQEMSWKASPKRLFVEALDAAMGGSQNARILRRSQHFEATVRYYREGMKTLPHPYFAPISVNQKEGIAVADVNGDGFDDIYITVRLGKNMLLINHGNGTFTEEAAAYKLDLPGHTTCALFADFDNDGDLDVILGRSLLRTSYLENRGGSFYQYPIPKFMPMAVISMAAADYNGDGLLDVYLCTYRPAAPAGSGTSGGYGQVAKEGDFDWPDEFFPPEQAREFRRRLSEHRQRYGASALDQLGPPNVLLVNRGGGRFEPAPENNSVGLWRNSLQATWCDYNEDGRPDLYIPNDWGMNVLFRNDGPGGFTDVTTEAGLTYYGFSMGASFGDYDNDGRDDLYISNMSSAAGRRIAAQVKGLDKMFTESALGNWLYHHEPNGKFKQVAGLQPPAMTVMDIGWSWGGCFADFDNDSFLDLYVLSGYFTAPKELASGLDLESNLWRTMVRADENLSRPSFRFSPEWRRTPPPDNLGPEIDARMAGVERRGDRILVHSLHGSERNRYFSNRQGRSFVDFSALSGLDQTADSRGFALLDYDRDGWQDVAIVNGSQPLFNLYHNEMSAVGLQGGMIAIRFVGGSRSAAPTTGLACRDGFGARVTLDLGDEKIVREHRCGEGWSTQNSATMIIGIGEHQTVSSVAVRWPSGKITTTQSVPEGTLLTAYENAAEATGATAFTRSVYRVKRAGTAAQRPNQ